MIRLAAWEAQDTHSSGRLLCVTMQNQAFAPTGLVGSLRPSSLEEKARDDVRDLSFEVPEPTETPGSTGFWGLRS